MFYRREDSFAVNTSILMIFLAFSIVSISFSYFGFVNFESWPQVTDLYAYHLPMYLLYDHPHFYRYLIAYPGLYLSEFYGDQMFSVYISLFMIISIYILLRIMAGLNLFLIFSACLAMIAIHGFMNGRGAISWCGWMLAIYVILRPQETRISIFEAILTAFALLSASVSTGTFAVTFGALVLSALRRLIFLKQYREIITLFPIVYLYWQYFILSFEKNIEYYRYGKSNFLVNMLEHGLGGLISNSPVLMAIVVFLGMILPFIVHFLRKKLTTDEIFILLGPLAGGIFGYTTLTLAIPSILVIAGRRMSAPSSAANEAMLARGRSAALGSNWS